MSRIGNKPIEADASLNIEISNDKVTISSGSKSLEIEVLDKVTVEKDGATILVKRKDDSKKAREQQGLLRSLISNAVQGLVKPFEKTLVLKGIGFKVMKKGSSNLEFSLGYSHVVPFEIVSDVEIDVQGQDKLLLKSFNKQSLGEACAKIIGLKRRDNYKGKGIYFDDEVIKKKPGKSVSK